MHWDHPRSREYLEGRRSLEAACAHRRKDAETLCALAESWVRDDESKARDLFHQAVAVDATEPVALSRYIEFEIAHVVQQCGGPPGGADDPQCDRPLPQADRGPRQPSLGLGQPAPCSICWSRSRTRPSEPLGN